MGKRLITLKVLPLYFSLLALFLFFLLVILPKPGVKKMDTATIEQVVLGNVTDSSFSLLVRTNIGSNPVLMYGDLGKFDRKALPKPLGKATVHLFTAVNLTPSKEFSYLLTDGKTVISTEEVIKTGEILPFPPSQPFFGRVFDKSNIPLSSGFLTIDIYPIGVKTPITVLVETQKNGSYTFNIGSVRNKDGSAYAFSKTENIEKIEVTVETAGGAIFKKLIMPPFTKSLSGTVELTDIQTDFSNITKDGEAVSDFSDYQLINKAFSANPLNFSFLTPGRWDIAIYNSPTSPLGAFEFLTSLNNKCQLDAYWLDRLENGAWESFILKAGIGYGKSFPIEYTKAYFVVVLKSNVNCSLDV